MNVLLQIAGAGTVILGVVYISVPKRIHTFGFDFLRDSSSAPSNPSSAMLWYYRLLGVALLVIGISRFL